MSSLNSFAGIPSIVLVIYPDVNRGFRVVLACFKTKGHQSISTQCHASFEKSVGWTLPQNPVILADFRMKQKQMTAHESLIFYTISMIKKNTNVTLISMAIDECFEFQAQ